MTAPHVPGIAVFLVDTTECQCRSGLRQRRQALLQIVLDGGGVERIGECGISPGVIQHQLGTLAHGIQTGVRVRQVGLLVLEFRRLLVHRDDEE